MKNLFVAVFLLLVSSAGFAQAFESSVKVYRTLQPAAVIQLPYTADIVSSALSDYLSKKGRSKSADIKGFTTFRNMQASANNSSNADLYFKVERKSRHEKGITLVSLLLTAPKEGDLAEGGLNYMNMEEAKAYLNGLVPAIAAYDLEEAVKAQNAVVIKAEARFRNIGEEGVDLDQKKRAVEKRISENRLALQSQEQEVQLQKQKLADLVGQRKN